MGSVSRMPGGADLGLTLNYTCTALAKLLNISKTWSSHIYVKIRIMSALHI